jgi:hypothetical protein
MFVQSRTTALRPTKTLTAATTLTQTDSGKLFYLALAGGFTVTLPNVDGFWAEFIVTVAPTTAYIIAAGTADTMAGTVLSASGGAEDTEAAATGDQLNFVASTAVVGDRAVVNCDGTNAYVVAVVSATGGATITG